MGKSDKARMILEMARGLSLDEYKEVLAEMLGRIRPTEPKGTVLCDAIMRVWATPAFEAVALRDNNGVSEVFLRKRAPDDTAYPGQWHVPGSLFRSGELDKHVAERLRDEFGAAIAGFKCVDWLITAEQRGTVHSLIFLVTLGGEPRVDDRHGWFPLYNLPAPMVDSHREQVIPYAHWTWRRSRGM